jgi:toxin CptA
LSHKKYASPLRLELKVSRTLLAIVVAVHLGAIAMLAISVMSLAVKLLLLSVILGSFFLSVSIHRNALMPAFFRKLFPDIKCIVWDNNDQWILMTEAGGELRGQLLTSSFVHPQFTAVNLKLAGMPWYKRYRSFVFMQDNLDAETFRRLRVRLRWYSMPDQDSLAAIK